MSFFPVKQPPRDVSQAATAKTGDIWIAHTGERFFLHKTKKKLFSHFIHSSNSNKSQHKAVMYVNEAFKWFKQVRFYLLFVSFLDRLRI